jgi:predicted ribosome quality control (RQC) complex YloA/Tae2 family protein
LSDELKKQFENLTQEKINYYLSAENYSPAILNDRYTLFSELVAGSISKESINSMLDEYYSGFQEKINLKNARNKFAEIVGNKLRRNKNAISKLTSILSKRENADKYKIYGELLTANLYKKNDYQKNIELYDYVNNKNIIIELDETKTMSENAQRYFRLYTKYKTTKEKSLELLNNLNIEKEYLENILYSIERADSISDLSEIEIELGLSDLKKKTKSEINVTKVEINGFQVYIGKNNKQNDYIVSKLSKEEDYWFHTKLCAGSHVLLKVNEIEPSEEIIFECAKLARQYSAAKQPSKVGVIYTKRKYIKKPPSAPLGYVIYRNEKEILI